MGAIDVLFLFLVCNSTDKTSGRDRNAMSKELKYSLRMEAVTTAKKS